MKTLKLPLEYGKRYVTGEGKIVRVAGHVRGREEWVHAGGMWFEASTGRFVSVSRTGAYSLFDGIKAISHDLCEVCEDMGGYWTNEDDIEHGARWEVCQCRK